LRLSVSLGYHSGTFAVPSTVAAESHSAMRVESCVGDSTFGRLEYRQILWSVSESRVSSRLPAPSTFNQLEYILHEQRYSIAV